MTLASAWNSAPQAVHAKTSRAQRDSAATWPHWLQVWLEYAAGTRTRAPPRLRSLYSSRTANLLRKRPANPPLSAAV